MSESISPQSLPPRPKRAPSGETNRPSVPSLSPRARDESHPKRLPARPQSDSITTKASTQQSDNTPPAPLEASASKRNALPVLHAAPVLKRRSQPSALAPRPVSDFVKVPNARINFIDFDAEPASDVVEPSAPNAKHLKKKKRTRPLLTPPKSRSASVVEQAPDHDLPADQSVPEEGKPSLQEEQQPQSKKKQTLGLTIFTVVAVLIIGVLVMLFAVPQVFGSNVSQKPQYTGNPVTLPKDDKINYADMHAGDYQPINLANVEGDEDIKDRKDVVTVEHWSLDWKYDKKNGAYFSKDKQSLIIFNRFALKDSQNDEEFIKQIEEITMRLNKLYGFKGIERTTSIDKNHSGDLRVGVYHEPASNMVEAQTIFNVSGNHIVANTVILKDEESRSDYLQMATSTLNVKAKSD